MSEIKKVLSASLILIALSGCNMTKEEITKEILKDAGLVAGVFCSDDMKEFRLEKLKQAKEKWPNFPLFDVCPLLNDERGESGQAG